MDLSFTLDFLTDLSMNNNKEWMDDNRKRYLQAKDQFIELVSEVITGTLAFDKNLEGINPKKTIFRINRDIRFSNNKDPYKTNFGASITAGGNKAGNPGYYLHLKPGENFFGGGLFQPESEKLKKVRQEIDYNGAEMRKIIEDKHFQQTFEQHYGERLKTAPKGYPKDHPDLDLLQLKSHVFLHQVDEKTVTSGTYAKEIIDGFHTLYPFIEYLRVAIS